MDQFTFHSPTAIRFGPSCINDSGQAVGELGRRPLLVCDEFSVTRGLAGRVTGILESAGLAVTRYEKVIPNPTADVVDAGAAVAVENDCDVVVGLGGGSSMDTAKGIAVAATHEGDIWPYAIGDREITDATMPVVAVTTTSGTGSQCTMFSVITNPQTRQKPGMGSPHILPRVAVVDPELMCTMPPALTAVTGFDVFTHAVEALTSRAASPLSDMYAREAISLLAGSLPRAYRNGEDMQARSAMALADTCAGVAINHAVVTLGHVIAHVISGHFEDIAHGDALRSIYREVLALNASTLPDKHAWVAGRLMEGCEDILEAFDSFFAPMGFENRLAAKNLSDQQLRAIAEDTFTYMKAITELNPRDATVDDAMKILQRSLQ